MNATQHDELRRLINEYADARDGAFKKIHEDYVRAHTEEAEALRRAKRRNKKQRWAARRAMKNNQPSI